MAPPRAHSPDAQGIGSLPTGMEEGAGRTRGAADEGAAAGSRAQPTLPPRATTRKPGFEEEATLAAHEPSLFCRCLCLASTPCNTRTSRFGSGPLAVTDA